MIEAEKAFRELAGRLWSHIAVSVPVQTNDGPYLREIKATPYDGAYDAPAGWVIAIQGSPPKGTFFTHGPGVVHYVLPGYASRIRKLSKKDAAIVMRYVHYLDALRIAKGGQPADDTGI